MASPIKNVVLLGVGSGASFFSPLRLTLILCQASGIPGPAVLHELLNSSLKVTVISRVGSKSTFP